MEKNDSIEILIERAFRANPWRGIISVEEAIADAVRYRCELSEQDRKVYDEQVLAGRHPIKAMETGEILAGRNQPHGTAVLQTMANAKSS
jgi:hypothetical protein